MSPEDVAKKLGVSVSSVYNARNGYFKPGRELAVKIEALSTPVNAKGEPNGDAAVPVGSWTTSKARKRPAAK